MAKGEKAKEATERGMMEREEAKTRNFRAC